jgi:hypothetical protein
MRTILKLAAFNYWGHSLIAVLLLAAPFSIWAQNDGPGLINVRFADVKPDQVAQFEAAAADVGAAMRAGGAPFFHVYQRVRGDMGYAIFTLDSELNDLPAIQLSPGLIDRATSAVNNFTVLSLAVDPALGIDSGTLEPAGRYMHVRVRTTSPGNAQAFLQAQADEVVPALRAGGVKDRRFGRVLFGGNVNTFVNFMYSDSFPGTGTNMVAQTMGQRNFDRMVSRLNALVSNAEDYVFVFRPDLSFTGE